MPKRRQVARDRRDPDSLSFELAWDRSSTGRQPVSLTGRLSLSHFTTGSHQGRRRCSAPHPSPGPTRRRLPGTRPPSDRP